MGERRGINRRDFLSRAGATGAFVAAGGLGTLLEACQSGTSTAPSSDQPVRGGTLKLATVDTPVNMDPQDLELTASIQVYDNIFAKLIELDLNYKHIPALATKWTQDDEKTWTLDLRDDVQFHNGDPFTADDVKFTFERIPDHAVKTFLPAIPVEVLGPHRVRFHLTQPYGVFLDSLATFSNIVNRKAVTSSNPKTQPVGCGPYRMVEWVQNDHITLEHWDKSYPGKPYADRAIFRAIGDDSVRLTGLMTGELDWIQRVPLQRVAELEKSTQINHTPRRSTYTDMVHLNATRPPFSDKRVRQAVAWAIDREEIAKLVYFGQAVPATEAVQPPNPLYSGTNPFKGGPDPEKAKSLLKGAGVTNLQVNFAAEPNVATQLRTGEVLKSQLAKVGIEMQIQNYAPAQWFQAWVGHTYDVTSTYWSSTNDPSFLYYPVGHSSSSLNVTGLKSPMIDQLLDKYLASSGDARKPAYADVVNAVAEEAAVIFIDGEYQEFWHRPPVHEPGVIPTNDIRAWDMWLKH